MSGQELGADEIKKGAELARARREVLAKLIESDPKTALEKTIPAVVRAQLPEPVVAELEERIDARGDYTVAIADGDNMKSTVSRSVEINGKTYSANVYGRRTGQSSQKGIPLHGIVIGNQMALHESPLRMLEPGETPDPRKPVANPDGICPIKKVVSKAIVLDAGDTIYYTCCSTCPEALSSQLGSAQTGGSGTVSSGQVAMSPWTQGNKTVLIINVKFSDQADSNAHSMSEVQTMMAGCDTFMRANSYGTTSMASTFTPLLMLPNTEAYYTGRGDTTLRADARSLATAAGYAYTSFDLDAVCWVGGPGNYGGLATVGGRGCNLKSATAGTASHEFGHNFGLWHANSWNTTDGTAIGAGSNFEYGDPFDTMGIYPGDYNACHKNRLGWLPTANVTTVTSNGTYRITAFDQPVLSAGAKYALKITKDSDRDYWVDFRQAITTNKWLMNGADLHWDPWASSNGGTQILDTTPGSPNGFDDSAILIGKTFADTASGIYITPIGKGGTSPESLDVIVNLGSFAGNAAPTVGVAASATKVNPNVSVTLTANATDPDGDTLAYFWDFGDKSLGSNGSSVVKSWTNVGNYVVRCTVSDMKGGTASNWIIVSVGSPATISVNPASLAQTLDTNQWATQTLNIDNIGGLPLNWALSSRAIGMSGGADFSLAVKDDGAVLACGGNASGQLGDGSTNGHLLPTPVSGLAGITQTASGFFHNLALESDGTVWAWGGNGGGQLGDGTTTNRATPVQVVGLSGVTAIACGIGHSIALKSDGTVWAWGGNGVGQLGDGTTTNRATPVQVPGLTGVVAIACGFNHCLAVKSDGTVWSWGSNSSGQLGDGTTVSRAVPAQVAGLSGCSAVACGANHSLALKSDGTVWAWGINNSGQLGNGSTTSRTTPVQVSGLSGITALACSCANHTLALKSDGTLRAWGANGNGQLGDGTNTNRTTPVTVTGLSGISKIATGSNHSLALKPDGSLLSWGGNSAGQLCDGTSIGHFTPTLVQGGLASIPAWLSVAPASGIAPGGGSSAVSVTFKSFGLSAGTYTTALGVSSNDTGTPLVTVPITLTVAANMPPEIASQATATPNPAVVNTSVSFSADATDPDGDALTYSWTFGDGGSASGAFVNHTYAATGNYTATVTVGDGAGHTATSSVQVTVLPANHPPTITVAAKATPNPATAGQNVTLSVSASDSDGDALTFAWNFGDGANGSGASVAHIYATPGTFAATVTVSDGRGGSATSNVSLAVTPSLSTGLMAHWKLDDAAGTTAADASGNNNTGALLNGPVWTAGRVNGAASFDGVDDRVDTAVMNHNVGMGDFTWAMWVYPQRLTNPWEGLMSNGEYSPALYSKLYTGQWGINWGGDKPSGNSLTTGRWYHLTVVRQGGVIKFYQDGVQTPQTYTIGTSMANNPIHLGTSGIATGARYGKSNLDDVRFYNRALSATEIGTIANLAPAAPVITSTLSATATVGTAFSYTITASNSPTSYNATGLPAGLTVNTSTGVISGTPTTAGTSNVTISAANAGGSGAATLVITVNPPAPAITSALNASATVGTAFSYAITASNGPTSYNATGLPAGLTVNTSTGVISGTPTATGTSNVTISAANAGGSGAATLVLIVNAANRPPMIGSGPAANPNPAIQGQAVTLSVSASDPDGDALTFAWNFGDGTNGSAASVTHAYANAGTYTVGVTVSDGRGGSVSGSLSIVVNSSLNSGLVANWKLDESSGTTAADASGNNNTGTLANGPAWTAGKAGGALSFDGLDDHMDTATINHNIGTGDFTWAMWVYPQRLTNPWEGLMSNGEFAPAMYSKLYAGQWGIYWGGDKPSGNTLTVGRWYQLAVVRQGGVIKFYQDGVQTPQTYAITTSMANSPVHLGTSGIATGARYGKSNLDDVRIYNRALTPAEISALLSAMSPRK